jgi:hypothetical protein
LFIDGQDVLTRGIPIKPIKDETTNQMAMPPENELTRRLDRNAVILYNNGLFLIMYRLLMFCLHHLLETEATVLAEERAKTIYNNICIHLQLCALACTRRYCSYLEHVVSYLDTTSHIRTIFFDRDRVPIAIPCNISSVTHTQSNPGIYMEETLTRYLDTCNLSAPRGIGVNY